VLSILGVLVGGVVELVPTIVVEKAVPKEGETATPYRPLELAGRDLYVREGCYTCHSQMIRPMIMDKLRYGEPSTAGEFIYDHPFQWGSKRTGPDLARTGGKMPNLWHWQHLMDPRSTSTGSNMPSYAFMADAKVSSDEVVAKMRVQQTLGTPYSDAEIAQAPAMMAAQQRFIADDLAKNGVTASADSEMVALIAYLQRIGKHPANPLQSVPGASAAAVATSPTPVVAPPGGELER
jgi:cytochrome c oxidase cbb3-type subunit I/II